MTLRDQLLPVLFGVRAIPGQLGLRNYTVGILHGTWNGAHTGRGGTVSECVAITEAGGYPPKVRQASSEEIALGNLSKGTVRIGPITPGFDGGGNPLENLKPCVSAGDTVHVLLTGPDYPNGAKFLIKDVQTDRALHWTLLCEPVSENPY